MFVPTQICVFPLASNGSSVPVGAFNSMVILLAEGTDEDVVVIDVEEIGRLDVDEVLELSEIAVEEVEIEDVEEEEGADVDDDDVVVVVLV